MNRQDIIKKRAIEHGLLFIKRNATIRSVGKETGADKTTVHLDLHRLEKYHPALYLLVKEKLDFNAKVRHIRGGESTKKIWDKKKGSKKNDSK